MKMFCKFCRLQHFQYFSNFTTFDTLYMCTTFSNPKIKRAQKENWQREKKKKIDMSINLCK